MITALKSTIAAGILALGSWLGFNFETPTPVIVQPVQVEEQQLGAFNPVQAQYFTLFGSGVSSSATSIILSSFKLPDGSTNITMTNLGDIAYATIEAGTSREEHISFTGVTQNANGTATLTGVTRGLAFTYPYAETSANKFSHAGGSKFILSNTAGFYTEFAKLRNNETITGLWRFNTLLPESSLQATSSTQLITLGQANNIATQGAATSTEDRGGLVELGTLAEQASSYDGGALKPTVLQTKNSTSTCQVVGSYNIVASSTTGKLDKNCFDQTANYTFTGTNSFGSGTTTVGSLNITNGTTSIGGVTNIWPITNGASSTSLVQDGNGKLIWDYPGDILMVSTTSVSATSTMRLTLPFSPQRMTIYASLPNRTDYTGIRFNSGGATSYGSRQIDESGNTNSNSNVSFISLEPTSTSTSAYFVINVNTISTVRKALNWIGTYYINATANGVRGYGVFNDTSNPITYIDFISPNGGTNLGAGADIKIYGR